MKLWTIAVLVLLVSVTQAPGQERQSIRTLGSAGAAPTAPPVAERVPAFSAYAPIAPDTARKNVPVPGVLVGAVIGGVIGLGIGLTSMSSGDYVAGPMHYITVPAGIILGGAIGWLHDRDGGRRRRH